MAPPAPLKRQKLALFNFFFTLTVVLQQYALSLEKVPARLNLRTPGEARGARGRLPSLLAGLSLRPAARAGLAAMHDAPGPGLISHPCYRMQHGGMLFSLSSAFLTSSL